MYIDQKELKWFKIALKTIFLQINPILLLIVLSGSLFLQNSCAVVKAPTGGPRDTIPPHLLGSIPTNYSRNFSGSEIILIFDEYIKIKDQSTSVFFSPEPEKPPEIKIKKKIINIKFKNALEKNRTYSINFGNAIVDNNEGNSLHNFKFVFATGPKIDSLKIVGHVSDPLDTTNKKDVFVILHKANKDSALYKSKPLLYTTTDKEGNFELSNIAPGEYSLYALEETNKNKKYDNKSESIAFLNSPIVLKKDTSGIQLNLFKEKEEKLKILSKKIAGGLMKIELNKSSDSITFRLDKPKEATKILVEKNASLDTTFIWLPKQNLDSVKFTILEKSHPDITFTLNNFVKNKKANVLTARDNLYNGLLSPEKTLVLRFSEPLKKLQNSNFTLTEDSIPVKADSIVVDTVKIREYAIYYPWETGHKYQLIIKKSALESIYGGKNLEFKSSWKLGNDANYGKMNLKITVPVKSDYIVYLMDEQFKILDTKYIQGNSTLAYKYLNPGKYRFRVVYDKNLNRIFDSGTLSKKTQPEKILNSKEVTIRANFTIELNLKLPPL